MTIKSKFFIILLIIFFSPNIYASCKFEFISMKSSFTNFEKKYSISMHMANPEDDIKSYSIPVEDVCKDKDYKKFPVTYSFIKNKLHQIFIEDIYSEVDHLNNLKKTYGSPTDFYEGQSDSGIKYYHWELFSKHVFLVIKFSPNETISNVEIVTNEFAKYLEERNESLEE